jgi:hypothetical protein
MPGPLSCTSMATPECVDSTRTVMAGAAGSQPWCRALPMRFWKTLVKRAPSTRSVTSSPVMVGCTPRAPSSCSSPEVAAASRADTVTGACSTSVRPARLRRRRSSTRSVTRDDALWMRAIESRMASASPISRSSSRAPRKPRMVTRGALRSWDTEYTNWAISSLRRRTSASKRRRSEMSMMDAMVAAPDDTCTGPSPISSGTSEPSLRRPRSSRPAPISRVEGSEKKPRTWSSWRSRRSGGTRSARGRPRSSPGP